MPIPSVDRARILEALGQFDREERASARWQGWETKENYKYAIAHDGQLYPVKEIISEATGAPTSTFSGGTQSNEYMRQRGFLIEALHLPSETEIQAALHDVLLMKAPEAVELAEAYRLLAEQFQLPQRLRTERTETSNEVRWETRVRLASRKLVDVGIIDAAEDGRWRLTVRTHPKVWIEKSLLKGRPDRVAGDHALGVALWSPVRAQNGADVYRHMRLVQPNDVVLHLTDNAAFTGVSVVDSFAQTGFEGLQGTAWSGLPCYRINLRAFSALQPPLTRDELVSSPELRARLVEIRRRYSNLFYDPDLDLHQGGYLTEAPPELVALLDGV